MTSVEFKICGTSKEALPLVLPPSKAVFVCLHGAAKSVIASSCLNQLAAKGGLDIRATAAGVDPEIPFPVREGLLQGGLKRPRR